MILNVTFRDERLEKYKRESVILTPMTHVDVSEHVRGTFPLRLSHAVLLKIEYDASHRTPSRALFRGFFPTLEKRRYYT